MNFHEAELGAHLSGIDTVVLDVGNVLFRFDTDHIREKFLSSENRKALGDSMFISDHEWCWGQFDTGLWDDELVAKNIANHAGVPHAWEEVLASYEHFHEDRVMLPLAYDIPLMKEMGLKVLGLTNYGKTGFDRVSKKFDFFALMDGIVVSGREKVVKPESGIYECLENRYGITPAHTLFIDDNADNIAAAKKRGWQTWHYLNGLNT